MNRSQAKARADMLKAIAHPVRILMLEELSRHDRCVKEMRKLAPISQPGTSRHLAWLKRAGIVAEYRRGPRVYHHLACPEVLRMLASADKVSRATKG